MKLFLALMLIGYDARAELSESFRLMADQQIAQSGIDQRKMGDFFEPKVTIAKENVIDLVTDLDCLNKKNDQACQALKERVAFNGLYLGGGAYNDDDPNAKPPRHEFDKFIIWMNQYWIFRDEPNKVYWVDCLKNFKISKLDQNWYRMIGRSKIINGRWAGRSNVQCLDFDPQKKLWRQGFYFSGAIRNFADAKNIEAVENIEFGEGLSLGTWKRSWRWKNGRWEEHNDWLYGPSSPWLADLAIGLENPKRKPTEHDLYVEQRTGTKLKDVTPEALKEARRRVKVRLQDQNEDYRWKKFESY